MEQKKIKNNKLFNKKIRYLEYAPDLITKITKKVFFKEGFRNKKLNIFNAIVLLN